MDALSRLIELSRLRPVLDIRCQLGGRFQIDHEPAPAGAIPFHLVVGGSCRIRTAAGMEVTLQSGDFLLLPRGDAHVIVDTAAGSAPTSAEIIRGGMLPLRRSGAGDPDVDLLCGHFECARGSSELLVDTLPNPFHAPLRGSHSEETLKTLVALLRQETALEQPGALAVVTALCLVLLVMALRTRNGSALAAPGLLSLFADQRLAKSVQAIVAAPARGWTIEALAELAAMSRATYARHFKGCSGMTVGAFLTGLRLALASDLLLNTGRPVASLAAEVGYESEAAFGKAFKAGRGLTPGAFRRLAK